MVVADASQNGDVGVNQALVASNLPPSPTSENHNIDFRASKERNSKNEGPFEKCKFLRKLLLSKMRVA